MLYNRINKLVEIYKEENNIYRIEENEDGDYIEFSLENELEELFYIFDFDLDEYYITISCIFNSPGLDIYAISLAWIDEGELYTYFDVIKRD